MQLQHILFLDIETVSITKNYSSLPQRYKPLWDRKAKFLASEDVPVDQTFTDKAAIFAEFGKVVVIGVGFFYYNENRELSFKTKAFYNNDEKQLLSEFKSFIESRFDQNVLRLCAHNGREFDYPYLCRRMLVNSISLPEILRINDKKPWEINHLDTLEMWKFGDKKNYTSLDLLATIFDIPTSKDDIDGSQVGKVYYEENGLERIATYCKKDVAVLAQVFLALTCQPKIEQKNIQYL